MNIKKIMIITLISLFALGILCGTASATHTFHKGKYKMTVTDKQYQKLKTVDYYEVFKKVGYKKKVTYGTKTVKLGYIKGHYNKKGKLLYNTVKKYRNGKSTSFKIGQRKYNRNGYTVKITYYGTKKVKKVTKEPIYMQATRSPYDHKIWVNLYKHSDLY